MSLRFGILATGTIAHKFASTMPLVPNSFATLEAVASRTQEKADSFAAEFSIPKAYGSMEALLADPEIDAVYVASPHLQHKPMTLAAIAAGKHVLCEKPLTLSEADSREVHEAAAKKGVFLMEAMWTRFLPTVLAAKQWLLDGKIGKLRYMTAAFGYNEPKTEPLIQIYDPNRASGALYDVGVYGIEAALDFFAPAQVETVKGIAALTEEGVDGVNAFLLQFSGGGIASLSSAICCETDCSGTLYGDCGRIRLYPDFYAPEHAELILDGKVTERMDLTIQSGFEYEIRHLCECVQAGKLTSERHLPEDTFTCARIFEELMKQGFAR